MKPQMTIEEALEFADEWSRGLTLYEDAQGWRVVCMLLAEEVRRRHGIDGELISARRERDELKEMIRELANTEIAEIACAGSMVPVEDILGRMFSLVPPNQK